MRSPISPRIRLRRNPRQPRAEPHPAACGAAPISKRSIAAGAIGLATANAGLITDIIACPGLDYCALANARSIPLAQEISTRFAIAERQREIGELKIKISGCINACGHHHVGHIGILGVEKKGAELYQITLGGSGDENTSIGEIIGRGFEPDKVTDAIETIVETYLGLRRLDRSEIFLDAYRRVGPQPCGARRALRASDARGDHRARGHRTLCRRNRCRVVLRRGFGSAAAHDFGSRPQAAGDLSRHRQAFRRALDYRDALAADFGLADIRIITPDEAALARIDPTGNLHQTSTDACCDVRKVEPMARGVEPFRAWFTGRKRFQAATRAALPASL
jgi:hypothetical protein